MEHSVHLVYGVEIPVTNDLGRLEAVVAEQPAATPPVGWQFLGDFERLFLTVHAEEVAENASAAVGPTAYTRHELPAWNRALHAVAVELGHPKHGLPGWLVLHDHS